MTPLPLQSEGSEVNISDYASDPAGWLDASVQDLVGAVGGWGLFSLLIGGTILYVSWEASPQRSLALPAAFTVLIGGMLIPVLPGNYRSMALSIIIVGLAAGFFAVAKRYVLTGGPVR